MTKLEEGQGHEQRNEDMNEEASEHVVGRAPEGIHIALGDNHELVQERSGVFRKIQPRVSESARDKLTGGALDFVDISARLSDTLDGTDFFSNALALRRI